MNYLARVDWSSRGKSRRFRAVDKTHFIPKSWDHSEYPPAGLLEAAPQTMERKNDPSGESRLFGYTIHTTDLTASGAWFNLYEKQANSHRVPDKSSREVTRLSRGSWIHCPNTLAFDRHTPPPVSTPRSSNRACRFPTRLSTRSRAYAHSGRHL